MYNSRESISYIKIHYVGLVLTFMTFIYETSVFWKTAEITSIGVNPKEITYYRSQRKRAGKYIIHNLKNKKLKFTHNVWRFRVTGSCADCSRLVFI